MADDLIVEFLAETNESLGVLDQDLVTLEQDPTNKQIIGGIFRVMHTIKGTCGFLGLSRLEKVAHAAENVMDKIRDGVMEVTPDAISLILEAIDAIKVLVADLEREGKELPGDNSELIARLNRSAEAGVAEPAKGISMAAGRKTPDLDVEIDFEPVKAPDAAASVTHDTNVNKTPDLDVPIDFDPVPAPDVDPALVPKQVSQPNTAVAKKESKLSDKAKVVAIKEGLKISEEAAQKSGGAGVPAAGAGSSIRVGIDVLESLMETVSELVLTRNQLLQISRQKGESELSSSLQRLNHITSSLQEGIMKTRMQPIGNAWSKFPRLIRDLALEAGKKIELKMIGADTELDRQQLEIIKDPLTHMVRNSADHGIEPPADRIAAGKPETGTVTLEAVQEGGHIIVKISDDGRGLNSEKIRAKIVKNGLGTEAEAAAMSDSQVYQYIFHAGFSTAEKVTSVSGRGVGMDVVKTNIEKIGGTIEMESIFGKGSVFSIKIPLTLAIMPTLIMEAEGQKFAVPQIRISEIVRASRKGSDARVKSSDYVIETIKEAEVLRIRGKLLPLVSLSRVLNLPPRAQNDNQPKKAKGIYVVVCEAGSSSFGLIVDRVFHTEEIVVKPVSRLLKGIEVYSGSTVLGDGSVIMILDVNGILKRAGISLVREEKRGDKAELDKESKVSFLVFKSWSKSPKAVPLELIARLEELDATKIEWSGDVPVMQYRGGLMRLVQSNPQQPLPTSGMMDVMVFTDEDKIMGLVVEEVLDIVEQKMDIRSVSDKSGMMGSMVIKGLATDVIDVSHFFSQAFGHWFKENEQKLISAENKEKHILLVDDSPFFRKFMAPVLQAAHYRVTTAENAIAALDLLHSENDFDLVVTDIDMPQMNGIEFVATCKADENLCMLPFVALTSHTSGDVVEKTAELGFSGYVSKADRDRLTSVIEAIFRQGSNVIKAAG